MLWCHWCTIWFGQVRFLHVSACIRQCRSLARRKFLVNCRHIFVSAGTRRDQQIRNAEAQWRLTLFLLNRGVLDWARVRWNASGSCQSIDIGANSKEEAQARCIRRLTVSLHALVVFGTVTNIACSYCAYNCAGRLVYETLLAIRVVAIDLKHHMTINAGKLNRCRFEYLNFLVVIWWFSWWYAFVCFFLYFGYVVSIWSKVSARLFSHFWQLHLIISTHIK